MVEDDLVVDDLEFEDLESDIPKSSTSLVLVKKGQCDKSKEAELVTSLVEALTVKEESKEQLQREDIQEEDFDDI